MTDGVLVSISCATPSNRWVEYIECANMAEANKVIAQHREREECYGIEVWKHCGCVHAVG